MNNLEINIECMKKHRPLMLEKINEILSENRFDLSKFDFVDTRDGVGTIELYDEKNNKLRLNSLYSPKKEAERWVRQFDFNNVRTSVLMFGIANGVFANEILEKLETDARLYLYEPDISLFIFCLKNFDMSNIINDNRVYLYIDEINLDNFFMDLVGSISVAMLVSQLVVCYPNLDTVYKESFVVFLSRIEQMKLYLKSISDSRKKKAHICAENIIRNIHFIKQSNYFSELSGIIPDNVPAIIVSAGPSLDKNVDELKKAKGKAFILATDTAVKTLLAHDINFDAIVTIDATKSPKHLEDKRCFKYPVFSSIYANNINLEKNLSRKIWVNTSGFLEELYKKFNLKYESYETGGSVSTAAFTIARILGAKRIVLIGQDLAFDGEYSHAGEVANHTFDKKNGTVYVEGINGNPVKTRGDWIVFRNWFSAEAKRLENDIEVINASEAGAKIDETEIMRLSDVIKQYCNTEFDFNKALIQVKCTFDGEKACKLEKCLKHLKKEIENIKTYAEKGILAAEKIVKEIYLGNVEIEEDMIKEVKRSIGFIKQQPVYSIIDYYISDAITDNVNKVNHLEDDDIQNYINIYGTTKIVLESIIKAVDALKPILDEGLSEL